MTDNAKTSPGESTREREAAKAYQRFMDASFTFNRIIDAVEARCMATDGPVTPTLREMREKELSELWFAVQTMRTALLVGQVEMKGLP